MFSAVSCKQRFFTQSILAAYCQLFQADVMLALKQIQSIIHVIGIQELQCLLLKHLYK